MKRTLLAFAVVAITNTSHAHDQANCKDIDNLLARLSCYDESHDATGSVRSTISNPAPAPSQSNSQPRSESSASTFGIPSDLFAARETRTMTATLVKLDKNPRRKTRLQLDNGQIWELTKDRLVSYPEGASVDIKAGNVGGYVMSVNSSSWFRVKRIDQ
jgi:hypothetical protein